MDEESQEHLAESPTGAKSMELGELWESGWVQTGILVIAVGAAMTAALLVKF
jgi:hypothetical protein